VSEPPRKTWWPVYPEHAAWKELVAAFAARRRQLGLSQVELAARIGLSEHLIGKYEAGMRRPSGFILAQWAQALNTRLTLRRLPCLSSRLPAMPTATWTFRRGRKKS
jgi:transcriptional regulator with XRE-family HTH domain